MSRFELIGDGDGNVLVFHNGQPAGRFYCRYSLPDDLEKLLEAHLCQCPPPPDESPDES